MDNRIEHLAGSRRDATIELFEKYAVWRNDGRRSSLQVKKLDGWRCFITEDPLNKEIHALADSESVSKLRTYLAPYTKEKSSLYEAFSSREQAHITLHDATIEDALLLATKDGDIPPVFLVCFMPYEEFTIFFGTVECFKIMATNDEAMKFEWAQVPDAFPSEDDAAWVSRRLAEVESYNNLTVGEWQTINWGIGEILEAKNLTLEEYQRQKGLFS